MKVGHVLEIVYHKRENLIRFREALRRVLDRNKKFIKVKTKLVKESRGLVLRITKIK